MKKFSFVILFFCFVYCCLSAQKSQNPKTDEEIKAYLVENGFADFKFYSNGVYEFAVDIIGGRREGKGKYTVSGGYVVFQTCDSPEKPCRWVENANRYYDMEFPSKYILDLDKVGLYYKGALINASDGSVFWSYKEATAYARIDYNGEACIRYPYYNEGVDDEYILILENLRLREMPSLSANLVTVYGVETDVGFYLGNRSIELAGTVARIRARTVKEDTIDGITAPWYLIIAYGFDPMGLETKEAWVFGGYVQKVTASERDKVQDANKNTLRQSILKLGGEVY